MHAFEVVLKAGIVRRGRLLVLTPAIEARNSEHDLPGGKLHLGEDPLAGLHREVFEETGLTVVPIAPVRMWSFNRDSGSQVVGVTFACRDDSDEPVRLIPREHRAFEWLSRPEIPLDWPEFAEFDSVFEVLQRLGDIKQQSSISQYKGDRQVAQAS